jgi:DNA polymerase-3 subunit epsilon
VSWHNEPMLGFDVESGGVNVEVDRIIQIAIVVVDASQRLVSPDSRLIDPGVDIAAEAIAIHGITNERLRAEGGDPAEVLEHFAAELVAMQLMELPVISMNGVYDFTILDRELRRHNLRPLEDRLGRPLGPLVDVRILDKLCQPIREGHRKLTDLCVHYGVTHDGAHDAGADALAACRVAWRMVDWGLNKPLEHFEKHPAIKTWEAKKVASAFRRLAATPLPRLHQVQVEQKKVQDADLAAYFRRKGKAYEGLDGHWPMIPFGQAELVGQQAIAS